jgi:hypothetical protein
MSETRHARAGYAFYGGRFMKTRRFALWIVAALIPLAALSAKPSVHLTHPPPGRYGIEELWKARVVTSDPADTSRDAWFEGFVYERTRGQVFHATTKPFRLSLGTRIYQYRDVKVDKTQTASGYETFVTRSGHLPAGNYRFKLKLQPFDVEDSFEFQVKPIGPPRLVSPKDGAALPEGQKYPEFSWTRPMPPPSGSVTYELKLFEVLPGQIPEEAVRANPPWFTKTGIAATSFTYPTSGRPLDTAAMYAWQVDVLDPTTGVRLAESHVSKFVAGGRARSGSLTRQQVIDIVLGQVVVPPILDHAARVFLGMSALRRGDRVRPFYDGAERTLDRPTWFAWVDDEPQAFFSHPTRYVFVDAYTGRLNVTSEDWWPVVNDVPLWMSDKEWTDKDLVIYSDVNRNR